MKEYHGYIYLTLDQKRNKIYIGQSTKRIEDSLDYFGSGKIIQRIIKSRGIYFLKKIILGTCNSQEELDEARKANDKAVEKARATAWKAYIKAVEKARFIQWKALDEAKARINAKHDKLENQKLVPKPASKK